MPDTQQDIWSQLGAKPVPGAIGAPTQAAQGDVWDQLGAKPVPGAVTTAPETTGVWGSIKRTIHMPIDLWNTVTAPATEQEKGELLQKIRQDNAQGDQWDESLATNPSVGTLVIHRLLSHPSDLLNAKSDHELEVARNLWDKGEHWKGAGLSASGAVDKVLSAIPLAGPAVNAIAERMEGGLVPMYNDKGERIPMEQIPANRKDVTGGIADALTMGAASRGLRANIQGAAAGLREAGVMRPPAVPVPEPTVAPIDESQFKYREQGAAPQHGTPVKTAQPFDNATINKLPGGKDLSTEAVQTLKQHVGETIEPGSTPKNTLMKAVAPVNKVIQEQGLALNQALENAGPMKTNAAAEVTQAIENLKKPLDLEAEKPLRDAMDSELAKARNAILSQNPVEVNNYIRELDKGIRDYSAPEGSVDTTGDARDAARVTIRRALRDKISTEIPATKPINDTLSKNLELRSHLDSKLGQAVSRDPVEAEAQRVSELNKGKQQLEVEQHNTTVARNRKVAGMPAEDVAAKGQPTFIDKAVDQAVSQKFPKAQGMEAEALKRLIKPSVQAGKLYGTNTDYIQALVDFDKLTGEEQAARFQNPNAIRQVLRSQAKLQAIKAGATKWGSIVALTGTGGHFLRKLIFE
jgi:hypothetical protein